VHNADGVFQQKRRCTGLTEDPLETFSEEIKNDHKPLANKTHERISKKQTTKPPKPTATHGLRTNKRCLER